MQVIKLIFIVFVLFIRVLAFGQSIDTIPIIHLDEVSIISRIEKLNSTNNIQQIDTILLQNSIGESLSDLLLHYTNVSIKSYGVTGISTLSLRGGNSYHTAVVWNGFNMQDPLNGGFNFALAPSIIADNIKVKYGGNSAIYGSGAMGGTIHLSNKPHFNENLKSKTTIIGGSFGRINLQEDISWGNSNISLSIKGFYNKTDNDFPFTNKAKPGFPTDTLHNARMKQYGLLLQNYIKINSNQIFTAHYWIQKNYSEVPPNMISVGGYASQDNNWHRIALNWKYNSNKLNIEARSGLFYTYLNYIKQDININAVHNSYNNINEVIANINIIEKSTIEFAINNDYTKAESDNFIGYKRLNKSAFFASFKSKLISKVILNVNGRIELIDHDLKPATFGIFGEYNFAPYFFANINVSKNHRSPTFNDLYWVGAFAKGNQNLNDEHGYSADFSVIEKHEIERLILKNKITFYINSTTDLIQWVNINDAWTPLNQKKVFSQGVEFSSNTKINISNNSNLSFDASYAYTKAQITEKSTTESDDVLNKQLIYTPFHQANLFLRYSYKKASLSINNEYTGEQFSRADNLDSIPSYFLINISANYNFAFKNFNNKVFLKINNILNADYMQMQWYPMPPVNFELGITVTIN